MIEPRMGLAGQKNVAIIFFDSLIQPASRIQVLFIHENGSAQVCCKVSGLTPLITISSLLK